MNIKILKALLYRHNNYDGVVYLSRHEYYKFGLTEWGMRKELRLLRRNGLLTVGKKPCGEKRFANVYNLSKKLLSYIKKQLRSLKPRFDIVKFNKETSTEDVKNMLGLTGYGKNYVLNKDDDYKYTYNSEYNIITRWSKSGGHHKWYNLFNGLKNIFKLNTYNLIQELG